MSSVWLFKNSADVSKCLRFNVDVLIPRQKQEANWDVLSVEVYFDNCRMTF